MTTLTTTRRSPRRAAPRSDGMPCAAHHHGLARLRAGGELHLARRRRASAPRACAPSAASGAATSSDGHQVVAVAQEALVLGDAHEHVEVARRPAALAGVAAAGERGCAGRPRSPPARRPAGACGRRRGRGPRHSEHGVSATLPSPPQTSQATARTTCPNGVRETARSWPEPPQRSQVSIGVPGSAPLPWQRSQASTTS